MQDQEVDATKMLKSSTVTANNKPSPIEVLLRFITGYTPSIGFAIIAFVTLEIP